MCFEDAYSHKPDKCLTATLKTQGLNLVHVFQVRRAFFFFFNVAECFFVFLVHAWSGAVWGEEGTKKKKKRRGEKNPLWPRVCARKRKGRDSGCTSIWSASFHRTAVDLADGLTDRTGTTSTDNTRCEGGVHVYPSGPAFCLKRGWGGAQHNARNHCLALFFFFSSFFFFFSPASLVSGMQDTQHYR